jgi:hypothetical protein
VNFTDKKPISIFFKHRYAESQVDFSFYKWVFRGYVCSRNNPRVFKNRILNRNTFRNVNCCQVRTQKTKQITIVFGANFWNISKYFSCFLFTLCFFITFLPLVVIDFWMIFIKQFRDLCNKRLVVQLSIDVSVIHSNSVITNSSGSAIFVRYNRDTLCTKVTNLTLKYVRSNQVFVDNFLVITELVITEFVISEFQCILERTS